MPDHQVTRRDVLRAGAGMLAATAAGATAGCVDQASDLIGGGSNAKASWAPDKSETVVLVDVQSILEDPATKQLANAVFDNLSEQEYYEGPTSYEDALETVEDESDLPPTKLHGVTGFGTSDAIQGGGDPYGGLVVNADWPEADVVDALEDDGTELTETDYNGRTIYEQDSEYAENALGVIAETRYVLGTREAVEDAIDVDAGDTDALSGDLRSAVESTRSGAGVRFATTVPDESVPKSVPTGEGDSIELDAYQDVPYVAGALYSTGDTMGLEVRLLAADEDTAAAVEEQTSALITFAKSLESTTDDMEAFLESIEVTRPEPTTVVITYEQPVDDIVDQIDAIFDQQFGG